jgi:hypothetical protein
MMQGNKPVLTKGVSEEGFHFQTWGFWFLQKCLQLPQRMLFVTENLEYKQVNTYFFHSGNKRRRKEGLHPHNPKHAGSEKGYKRRGLKPWNKGYSQQTIVADKEGKIPNKVSQVAEHLVIIVHFVLLQRRERGESDLFCRLHRVLLFFPVAGLFSLSISGGVVDDPTRCCMTEYVLREGTWVMDWRPRLCEDRSVTDACIHYRMHLWLSSDLLEVSYQNLGCCMEQKGKQMACHFLWVNDGGFGKSFKSLCQHVSLSVAIRLLWGFITKWRNWEECPNGVVGMQWSDR